MTLRAPFPWFGGKRRVAHLVWERFGDVGNYVEPFAGSLAVLLARPHDSKTETVNDADAYLANFWRAVQHDPNGVAHYADWPVNEADLHARHLWLVTTGRERVEVTKRDPAYYDVQIAGWWVWGLSQWIGSGWCQQPSARLPHLNASPCDSSDAAGVPRQAPRLSGHQGIHRPAMQLPELHSDRGIHQASTWQQRPSTGKNGGQGVYADALLRVTEQRPHHWTNGVHAKRPELKHDGKGMDALAVHNKMPEVKSSRGDATAANQGLIDWMRALCERLRRVRVCCGDWSRVMGPSVTFVHGVTGVFLDPPYAHAERAVGLYRIDHDISVDVRAWALANGDNPLLRIALCGYVGEHEMPDTWERVVWKAAGGYGSQGQGRGRENAERECIWFSPACRKPDRPVQLELFAGGG